jgi:hypothetical protein
MYIIYWGVIWDDWVKISREEIKIIICSIKEWEKDKWEEIVGIEFIKEE